MINLITGNSNQGKTSFIESLYEKHRRGDGIISVKAYKNSNFLGYDLKRLKTGEKIPLARTFADFDGYYNYGKFFFSEKAFSFATKIFNKLISEGIEPLYIDEIGPLEIFENKGFYQSLQKILKTNKEIYLSIRIQLLEPFIKTFEIDDNNLRIVKLLVNGHGITGIDR